MKEKDINNIIEEIDLELEKLESIIKFIENENDLIECDIRKKELFLESLR